MEGVPYRQHAAAGDLIEHDAAASAPLVNDGPMAGVVRDLDVAGRGERLLPGATTDVWTLDRFAYIGTFSSPCGDGTGDNGSGVRIFDVHNPNKVTESGFIPSPAGSRANDVKVADMNGGAILVHSNERCGGGGVGGFEIWNVDDPTDPEHLAHVQTDDVNAYRRSQFGLVDFGVHNLFLFSQGDRDYAAAVVESRFGRFQIFDITDPSTPLLVGFWGAEELRLAELGLSPEIVPDLDADDFELILELEGWLFSGFGVSKNRFLHDVTISDDGTRAYLSNWDAGVVLLDISDPFDPTPVSVAIDPSSSDGEVNSHAAWPSDDGSIVVETEEDFRPFELSFAITDGPNTGEYPSAEGAFTTPIAGLQGGEMSGPTTFVGYACDATDPVPAAGGPGEIAVIRRWGCQFDEKAQNAIDAGFDGMVVFNDPIHGASLVRMIGVRRDILGVFVGHSTALAIFDVADVSQLNIGDVGASVSAVSDPNGWGDVRIWDYSDPANPVLASTFDTLCSASPQDTSCVPLGTYSAHNVVVEEGKAYISWYSNGVLVLDVSDPYNPVEIARYLGEGPEFESENGGIQNVWGVYKEPNSPWIYASDRNGGLYLLKQYGSASAGRSRP